jgi:hypothetical protein
MKEFINYLADPIRSFPIFCLFYYLMMKYYRIVGTKKFAIWSLVVLVPMVGWFAADPNFIKIITWPDNVPISILIISVTFLTWLTLHKAAVNDNRLDAGECPVEAMPENREKVWSWPNLVYTELFAIIACTVFLIVWSIILKAPLEEPANPTWAPNPAKAPWYFLGLQEMLVYFDPWMAGVVLPGVIIVGMIAIPYIDTNPKGNGYYTIAERPMAIWLFMFGWLVLWVYLIIIGTFMRGPNWTFYGPFEFWDFHKVVAAYNINLSEYIWLKGLNAPMPGNMFLREIFGIILSIAYIAIPPVLAPKLSKVKELISKIGYIRYYFLMGLFLLMMSLPIKMFLRWLFDLKYIVALPEIELNL